MTMVNAVRQWSPQGYQVISNKVIKFYGDKIGPFAFKRTPVTCGEWKDWVTSCGQNRFVAMFHKGSTGDTLIEVGENPKAILGNSFSLKNAPNWDTGEVMFQGPLVLFQLNESPASEYSKGERVFDRPNQPVVGVSWFHAMAYCLMNGTDSYQLKLPTDVEYYYVSSNGGKQDYGTSTGGLYGPDGKKLAHIDEYKDGKGTTVDVDDPRYPLGPFEVQTCGNVYRWIAFNPNEEEKYSLRGGSWRDGPDFGRTSCRGGSGFRPGNRGYGVVGLSPVAVPQDSK